MGWYEVVTLRRVAGRLPGRESSFVWLPHLFRLDDHGQAIVETALIVPLLLFGCVGGADLARAFAIELAVQNGARAGAESYALDRTPSVAATQQHAVDEVNRTPGVTISAANVAVSARQSDGVSACISPPTVATPCFVTVEVTYQFRTIVTWPLIPNVANLDRSTTVRVFK